MKWWKAWRRGSRLLRYATLGIVTSKRAVAAILKSDAPEVQWLSQKRTPCVRIMSGLQGWRSGQNDFNVDNVDGRMLTGVQQGTLGLLRCI